VAGEDRQPAGESGLRRPVVRPSNGHRLSPHHRGVMSGRGPSVSPGRRISPKSGRRASYRESAVTRRHSDRRHRDADATVRVSAWRRKAQTQSPGQISTAQEDGDGCGHLGQRRAGRPRSSRPGYGRWRPHGDWRFNRVHEGSHQRRGIPSDSSRAANSGRISQPVDIPVPPGITFVVLIPTRGLRSPALDKQLVGETAAKIRSPAPPGAIPWTDMKTR